MLDLNSISFALNMLISGCASERFEFNKQTTRQAAAQFGLMVAPLRLAHLMLLFSVESKRIECKNLRYPHLIGHTEMSTYI